MIWKLIVGERLFNHDGIVRSYYASSSTDRVTTKLQGVVSEQCIELVLLLLARMTTDRPNARGAIGNPWMQGCLG